ncbi:MAG TPA: DUF2339 domain-containing protein [Gemmatimonadales bacterium]|nr:DUF2339 domain-containing protein [Gemmatimonadales bacterium]
MSDEPGAIERLERRVAALEDAMHRLIALRTGADILQLPSRPRPLPKPESTPPTPWAPAPAAERPAQDLEQWFGQRGLLVVGVVALLAAGGFFLKYAFDRHWISPLLRSLLAIAVGTGVAAWGDQRIRNGMRRYGAALIGAGGGLVYLGLWAAAGPYALVDRRVGVLLLAASTALVTFLALHHEIEGLAIWALAGAYLAPALLPPPIPDQQAFLGYLEVVGIGTGVLAYSQTWRLTFNLALFGYLLLAATGAAGALQTPLGAWFIAAGALLTLHVTRQHTWPEARLGVVLVAWMVLGASFNYLPTEYDATLWLGLGAGFAVAGLVWWQQLKPDPFAAPGETLEAAAERLLFLSTPFALILIARAAGPQILEPRPGLLPAVLGAIYLAAGWTRRTPSLLVMGFALGALACVVQWDSTVTALCWTGLALAALGADRWADRPGARPVAVGLAFLAGLELLVVAVWYRRWDAPVFTDLWALALYAYLAATVVAARAWRVPTAPAVWERRGAEAFWVMCGAATLVGGSIQLTRYFGRQTTLAGNLALSVWWLVYAGALVQIGFRLNRKDVRSAGLVVAAAAALKVVLYDLSTLDALYRVAVFFVLALIALAVAYAYNKRR